MANFLEIKDLHVAFKSYEGVTNVLDIDELSIEKGKAYGLAGKSVLALAVFRLLAVPPAIISCGTLNVDGEDLLKKQSSRWRISGAKKWR